MAINLGDISFGLVADTGRLKSAISVIQQFGNVVDQAAAKQGKSARATEAALRRQEKASIDALTKVQKLQDQIYRSGAPKSFMSKATSEMNLMAQSMASGKLKALEFQRTMERFQVGFSNAQRQLATYNNDQKILAAAQKAAEKQTAAQNAQYVKQAAAVAKAEEAVKSFMHSAGRAGAGANVTGGATGALSSFKKDMSTIVDPATFQRSQAAFTAGLNNAKRALMDFKNIKIDPLTGPGALAVSFDKMASAAVLIAGPLSGVATRLSVIASLASEANVALAAFTVGAAVGAFAFLKLGQSVVNTAKTLEKIELTLTGVSGSTAIAATEMKYLFEVSNRSGVALEVLGSQYARLTAAAKGTGFEGERIRSIFEAIVFASAKLGSSSDDTAGAIKAVEQIISKGTVSAEELRGQLGDRLPGAFQIMASAIGVTTKKLGEMMKKGEVSAGTLIKFTEELKKRFNVDPSQNIDTIAAAEGRLANAFTAMNEQIDKTVGFSEAYKNVLGQLATGLNWVGSNIQTIIPWVGALAAAIVAAFAPAMITSVYAFAAALGTQLVTAVRSVTAAILVMNVATAGNAFVTIAATIIRVAGVIAAAVGAFKLLQGAIDGTANAHLRALPNVKAYIAAQTDLKSSIAQTTGEYIKQQQVFAQGVLNSYAQEEAKLTELTKLKEAYGQSGPDPSGMGVDTSSSFAQAAIEQSRARLTELGAAARSARDDLHKLYEIQNKQVAVEKGREKYDWGAGSAGSSKTEQNAMERKNRAVRDAIQAIDELNQKTASYQLPQNQRELALAAAESAKSIADFKDKLVDAKIPLEQANALTQKYSEALKANKKAVYDAAHVKQPWEVFGEVVGRGMDNAMTTFVDGLIEGKNAMELFKDASKAFVSDLIKTFLQLSVLNPIKNMLFGQANPTMGTSGILGGLFGNAFSVGMPAAKGMAVTPAGARFARGGVFNSPTRFNSPAGPVLGGEAGPEALMPLTRNSKGQLAVHAENPMSGRTNSVDQRLNITIDARGSMGNRDLEMAIDRASQRIIKLTDRRVSVALSNDRLRGRA